MTEQKEITFSLDDLKAIEQAWLALGISANEVARRLGEFKKVFSQPLKGDEFKSLSELIAEDELKGLSKSILKANLKAKSELDDKQPYFRRFEKRRWE